MDATHLYAKSLLMRYNEQQHNETHIRDTAGMADSIVQPNPQNSAKQDELVNDSGNNDQMNEHEIGTQAAAKPLTDTGASLAATIIWTPRFIVLFALTLAIGLTGDCLFALGYGIRIIEPGWVLLGHAVLIAGCFCGIVRSARSRWIRLGGIFGCLWIIFTCLSFSLTLIAFNHGSPAIAYLNAAMTSALLGTYICFSLKKTRLTRWDSWFFGIAIVVSLCLPIISYLFMPVTTRSLAAIESSVAAINLVLCILVWWLRPSCWHKQPGTTFLLGMTPFILLLLAIPSIGRGQINFFLSEVALLSLLLGTMRVWQAALKR